MNYKEAMEYIDSTSRFGVKLGLERTERILELLGNPHKKTKFIHIAGTNGKGSTTMMLSKILIESGYKVGMYTSPYIEEFEERIQINNQNIRKEDFAGVITKIADVVKTVVEEEYGSPTYFELITCAGFLYFHMQNVDIAVIEVGLGGRLDSTNVITPILSIITSISLDHTHILGNTLGEIAYEKAGIIKENVPVVLYPQQEEAEKVIEKICVERKSDLVKVSSHSVEYLGHETEAYKNKEVNTNDMPFQTIKVTSNKDTYNIELSLLGKHQLLNCAVVIHAVEVLNNNGLKINKENIIKALSSVKWPARLEVLRKSPLVVIDGAHNIDAIKKLKENISTYFKYNKLVLILGILADKQVKDMIETITPLANKVITVTPNSDRAELAADLRNEVIKVNPNCEVIDDYYKAYEKGLNYCEEGDILIISGSLYMVGDMRRLIRKHSN